jgi:hypothetical protein
MPLGTRWQANSLEEYSLADLMTRREEGLRLEVQDWRLEERLRGKWWRLEVGGLRQDAERVIEAQPQPS